MFNFLLPQLSEGRGLPASGCDALYPRHQGRSRSRLLRAIDNEGGGVSSAFPKGKQNGIVLKELYLIYRSVMKLHWYLQKNIKN